LDLELKDKPDHPFVLFNLGMTYADMADAENASRYLRRCLEVSEPQESHVRKAYSLLVCCLVELEADDEAWRVCRRGRELFPRDAELLFRQGIVAHRRKELELAIDSYRSALRDDDERHFASRDTGITGYKARHNLAHVYEEIQRHDLAELQWRLALQEQPTYENGWLGLVLRHS
jgi:tetratricopeptide (TPR) repeat protein